jgi:hypothetical protein
MTCQLHRRLDRLLTVAAQVNERLTLWRGRDDIRLCQASVVTDCEGAVTGQGTDSCLALTEREGQLRIEPLDECRECTA